jgi:hypothetical protein
MDIGYTLAAVFTVSGMHLHLLELSAMKATNRSLLRSQGWLIQTSIQKVLVGRNRVSDYRVDMGMMYHHHVELIHMAATSSLMIPFLTACGSEHARGDTAAGYDAF